MTCCDFLQLLRISTHTPLARRDTLIGWYYGIKADFYSHASCEA